MSHKKDRLERCHLIVDKLWASKSSIGLNEHEWAVLVSLVDAYVTFRKLEDVGFDVMKKSELKQYQRLIDKKIVYYDPAQGQYSGWLILTDLEKQELVNAVDVEGMAKGGKVKEWITANTDKVAYPKLRTPDKKIWTLHSACKTREEAEAKRDAMRDGFYDDAKILDIYDGTNQKIYVYVTGEKETGAEPICKITVMENGKKVVLNCFTEEEKKETFEEIKMRKLPIIDVSSKMASGGSAKGVKKDDTEIKISLDDVAGISSGMLHKKGEYDSYSVKRLMHHLGDNEFYSKLVGQDMYLITTNRVYVVPSISQEAYSSLRVNFPYDTPIGKAGTSAVPNSDKYGTMDKGGKAGEPKRKTLEYVNERIQEKYPDLEVDRHSDRPKNRPTYWWIGKEGTKTGAYVSRQYSQTITSYVDLNTPIAEWIAEADTFMAEFKLPEKERKYDYGYAKGGNISSGSMTLLEDSPVNINFSKGTFSEEGLNKEQIIFLKHIEKLWLEDKLNQKSKITALEKYKRSGKAEEILDALQYWESLNKPLDKQSAFHPSYLSDYLVGGGNYHLQINVGGEFNSRKVGITPKMESTLKETTLLYALAPKNYYFKITQSGGLYIEYQSIIGSRMIASNVIVDYKRGGDTSPKAHSDINWLITG